MPDSPNQSLQDRAEPTHGNELGNFYKISFPLTTFDRIKIYAFFLFVVFKLAYLFGHPLLSNGTVGTLGYFPNRKFLFLE